MAFLTRQLIQTRKGIQCFYRLLTDSKEINSMMEGFKPLITPKMVHETGICCNLKLSSSEWTLDLRDDGTIKCGVDETADITLDMQDEIFLGLVDGSTTTAAAYMTGKLKLEGNIMQAMKLSALFKEMQSAVAQTVKDK